MSKQTVVVLGASDKPERFSNMAIKKLKQHGHRVIPVHPRLKEIEGLPVMADLLSINELVDTLTLYVGPERSANLVEQIIQLQPGRVIFNPGTESELLERSLRENNMSFEIACTLVMLDAGSF